MLRLHHPAGSPPRMASVRAVAMRASLPARALLGLIQLYKWTLSPFIGRECRYLPTCSSYAAEAIARHGAWAGSWMAAARLCRCHPWGGSGYDPAPAQRPQAPFWAPWRLGDWRLHNRADLRDESPDGGAGDPR